MKLSTLSNSALAILSVTSSTAYAACHSSGTVGFPRLAQARVNQLCTETFSGNYQVNNGKIFCLPIQSVHYNFMISNQFQVVQSLSTEDCVKYLTAEVKCPRGGETTYANLGWRFQATPSPGGCL